MNKVIWITGASSGIGKSLAIKFANEGWEVAISARRTKILNEISKPFKQIKPFPLDVNNANKCKQVFKEIKQVYKNIDICIFCTGINNPLLEKKFNLYNIRKIMETNFFGTINSINSVIDYFKNKKSGNIVVVSSVASYRGLPAAGAYCASKSALTSFAESLFFELKRHNIKISIISPGFIKTPMTDKNSFLMPMIQTPEFAANKIYNGIIYKNNFEIHFPKSFTYLMKIIKILPYNIYFRLIDIGNKYMKRDK